jgi:hypothetical protein
MITARIFQRPKSAMSSGKKGRVDQWILEFERVQAPKPDPLTGWPGGGTTRDQISLPFPSKEAAIAHAEREGFAFHVTEAPQRTLKLQAYADNFR